MSATLGPIDFRSLVMTKHSRQVQDHVFGRCGAAVGSLCEAGLLARPELGSSENEVLQWWLVSAPLAARLREQGQAVLEFDELHFWASTAAERRLDDDPVLRRALAGVTGDAPPN